MWKTRCEGSHIVLILCLFCSKGAVYASSWQGNTYSIDYGYAPLATINNEYEQKFIADFMTKNDIDEAYIGLKLDDYGLHWEDGTPVTYTNFKSGPEVPKFEFRRVCAAHGIVDVVCPTDTAIRVLNVFLGRRDSHTCTTPGAVPAVHCQTTARAFDHVRNDCHGLPSCQIDVNYYSELQPNCDSDSMYLEMQYTCSEAQSCSRVEPGPNSCYQEVFAGNPCPVDFRRIEIESRKENEKVRSFNLEFSTGAVLRAGRWVWPSSGSSEGLADVTQGPEPGFCVLFQNSQLQNKRCDNIQPLCEKQVSFPEECVVADADGYWRTNNCTEQLPHVAEAIGVSSPEPLDLDCLVRRSNTSTVLCTRDHPVVLSCYCPCSTKFYDIIGSSCECSCNVTAPDVAEAMCCSDHLESGLATSASSVQLDCNWSPNIHENLPPRPCGIKYCNKLPMETNNCAGMCCSATFNATVKQFVLLPDKSISEADATHILNATDEASCKALCIQRAYCAAYRFQNPSYSCLIVDDVNLIEATLGNFGNPTYTRVQDTTATLSSSVQSRDAYSRDLRAYALAANIPLDACQATCMANTSCGVTYWSENICFLAGLEDIRNGICCTLVTNSSYTMTAFQHAAGILDSGSSFDCYAVSNNISSTCPLGYAMTGCACSEGDTYVLPDACECMSSTATAVCCQIAIGIRQVCPPGQKSVMASCVDCPPGTFSAAMGGVCPPCPPGHVVNVAGSDECHPCPFGEVSNKARTECILCPFGWTTYSVGSTECELVDCGVPPNVSLAEMHYANTTFTAMVSYSCYDGAMLTNGTGFLICGCLGNWTGEESVCTNIDDCYSEPCLNNATCEDYLLYFNCTCDVGFTGINCETDIDDCFSYSCHNNGTCEDLVGNFTCHCAPGFTGWDCSINIDDCDPNPCFESNCTDLILGYNCSCPEGRYGQNCTSGCGAPPTFLHAYPDLPDNFKSEDGVSVPYNCSVGFNHALTNTLMCNITTWEGDIYCQPINCSSPPSVQDALPLEPTYTLYGDVAVYACDVGFQMINGTGLATCTCSGQWIRDEFACERLWFETSSVSVSNSTVVSEPPNSTVVSEPPPPNSTEPAFHTISPLSLGPMPSSGNDGNNSTEGITNSPSEGSTTSKLNGGDTTSKWDEGPVVIPTMPPGIPNFVANVYVQCSQAPDFPNTIRDNDTVFSGTYIRYRCPYGHWFASNNLTTLYVLCNGEGEWTPNPEGCTPVYCGYHPMPANLRRSSDTAYYGEPVEYQCDTGSTFPDGTTLRSTLCLPGGNWSVIIPSCRKKECGDLATNAPIAQTNISRHGMRWAHLKCTGQDLFSDGHHERWVSCLRTGKWERTDNDCRPGRCRPLPYVENAAVRHPFATDAGQVSLVECNRGYRFPNGFTWRAFLCLRDSSAQPQWNETLPDMCEEIVCPPVPHIWYAIPDTDRARIGTVVTYRCSLTFRWFEEIRSPNIDIECLMNETWATTPYGCEEIHCGGEDLLNISNADMLTFGDIPGMGDMPSKQVHYRCLDGMNFLDGSKVKVTTCSYRAEWQPLPDPLYDCRSERCDVPPPLDNTFVVGEVDASNESTLTYKCLPGYMFRDQSHTRNITCTATPVVYEPDQWIYWGFSDNPLQWRPEIAEGCIPVVCPSLHAIPNLVYEEEDRRFSAEVNISCTRGHRLVVAPEDWTIIHCTKYSTWNLSIDDHTCQPVNCSTPRQESYAFRSQKARVSFMSHVFYQCFLGFEYEPDVLSKMIMCEDTGVWVHTDTMLPSTTKGCLVTHCPLLPNWDDTYVYHTDVTNAAHTVYTTEVNYSCATGYNFHTLQAYHVIRCGARKHWEPSQMTCHSENASIFDPVPLEAPQSKLIATIAMGFMSIAIGFVIALDIVSFAVKISNSLKGAPTTKTGP